jgi:ABC-type multidrug transport system ATPase subunit
VLVLHRVARSFAGRRVLGPVSLELHQGGVCLVEGANGSGKTTLLRVAAGLLAPTGGTRQAGGGCVYLRPGAGARVGQSVRQALGFAGRMSPGPGMPVGQALAYVGLDGLGAARVAGLSSGQRARLAVAVALVACPPLVCLDEPTAHLDDDGAARVRAAVGWLADAGVGVLLATHQPDALTGLADGRLRLAGGVVAPP